MDRNIPDAYLKAIGAITVEFADLEFSIVDSISVLMFEENLKLAALSVGGDSFDTLLLKLTKMFMFRFSDEMLLKEFKGIVDRLKNIQEQRNKYLHSFWFIDKNKMITRLKFSRKLNKQKSVGDIENTAVETLFDFAKGIRKVKYDLLRFIFKTVESKNGEDKTKDEKQNLETETGETSPS